MYLYHIYLHTSILERYILQNIFLNFSPDHDYQEKSCFY